MERLTEKRQGQNVIPLRQTSLMNAHKFALVKVSENTSFLYGDAANKLASYEDTGLTPEEIRTLQAANVLLQKQADLAHETILAIEKEMTKAVKEEQSK